MKNLPTQSISRREMLKGGLAVSALWFIAEPLSTLGFNDPNAGTTLIPFLDVQPAGKMLKWENLTNWVSRNEEVFAVSHYGVPNFDLAKWTLEISGLVNHSKTLTLADLKARRRKTVTATLECSGNSSSVGFMGAIGNVKWTGTPLGPLLKECGLKERGIEVVFFGADEKTEKIRDKDYTQNFARSLSRGDAFRDDIILAYEMNGEPLPKDHGAPLRLIVPGWFGIAWVKWLSRIEVLDRRYMSKYMAREYVTIRGEERNGKMIWRETGVGPMDVKSITARALRLPNGDVRFSGAAWTDGTPLDRVEIKIDDASWRSVHLDTHQQGKYAWSFWNYDWKKPSPGDHTIVSRAVDREGRIQPAAEDPEIKMKRTYWEANQQWPRKLRI